MCGSAPKTPSAPQLPPPPPPAPNVKANKAQAGQAANNEQQKAALATGQQKTILTGPLGVTEQPNLKKKTLLSGVSA